MFVKIALTGIICCLGSLNVKIRLIILDVDNTEGVGAVKGRSAAW